MKLGADDKREVEEFFKTCPPFVFSSRETDTYNSFGKYAKHAYDGICFSFFCSDYYAPCGIDKEHPYWVCNFDKIGEPDIWEGNKEKKYTHEFSFEGQQYFVDSPDTSASKTDRFTDALIYAKSIFPGPKRADSVGKYKLVRTDQRFYPHYRSKIYSQANTFCADIPYGYLNVYANSQLTLSDRIHACAVTLAFGHSAMLFVKTNRVGLLERVGAGDICKKPVKLDLDRVIDHILTLSTNWVVIGEYRPEWESPRRSDPIHAQRRMRDPFHARGRISIPVCREGRFAELSQRFLYSPAASALLSCRHDRGMSAQPVFLAVLQQPILPQFLSRRHRK